MAKIEKVLVTSFQSLYAKQSKRLLAFKNGKQRHLVLKNQNFWKRNSS